MHKFLLYNKFIVCLYMFRALCAHHKEVNIVLYSIWYHHTCSTERPFASVISPLLVLVLVLVVLRWLITKIVWWVLSALITRWTQKWRNIVRSVLLSYPPPTARPETHAQASGPKTVVIISLGLFMWLMPFKIIRQKIETSGNYARIYKEMHFHGLVHSCIRNPSVS